MDLNEEIFEKKLHELNKNIFASVDKELILNELDNLHVYIKNKWYELEFFKKFDEMINAIFIPRVLKEKEYVDGFLKKYLNIYFEMLKTDFFSSWGLVFAKILMTKNLTIYPSIFSYLFKLIFPKLPKVFDENDVIFPLENNISLYDVIKSWLPIIEEQIIYSSSYNLFLNSKLRNNLIMHLYKKYNETKNLNIWFPFAGIGIEPLLFSYLMLLVIETDKRMSDSSNFFVHCSDHNSYIIEKSLTSGLFDELLIKAKEDFCNENGIKLKEIKTTIKHAKRKIIFHTTDLIYKIELIEKKFDTIIINSLKLSDYESESNKFQKILNKLNQSNIDPEVIYEIKSENPMSDDNFDIKNIADKKIIDSDFICFKNDYHLYLLSFLIQKNAEEKKESFETFDSLYINHQSAENDDLKKRIQKININELEKPKDKLKYAELLAVSGYHSKSYDIIKKYYKSDYNLSFKVLHIILSDCKNQKLLIRVDNFITENQIKEKGFSGELLDAIAEEIDDFFEKNPKSILNKAKWLV